MDIERPGRATLPRDSRAPAARGATRVDVDPTYDGWHRAARQLLAADVPPDAVTWHERSGEQPLLDLDAGLTAAREGEPSHERRAGARDAHHRSVESGAVLRGPDEAAQGALYAMLLDDLRAAAAALGGGEPPGAGPS